MQNYSQNANTNINTNINKRNITFIVQQLIVISILVLVNVYYYHRLDSVFGDKQTVKYRGAIETLKSQIASGEQGGADADGVESGIESFQSFIHKTTSQYKPINTLNRINPFSLLTDRFKERFEEAGSSGQGEEQNKILATPMPSNQNAPQTESTQNQSTPENVKPEETTTQETTTSTTQESSPPANVVNCQEVVEIYPQKDKNFNITGTKLGDFQEMFNHVQQLSMVCKQQIPIGSIIPFVYYYEYDNDKKYKLLLDDKTQSTSPVQILLRKTDNLVLVPLLGGVLTKDMVSKVLGSECVFIKAMFAKSDKLQLANTDKKVLKQVTDASLMNATQAEQSGLKAIIQKIKKSTLFFHDVGNDAKWSLASGGKYYTSPPANHRFEAKRGGVSKKKATYMQNQARDEANTTTYYNEQKLDGDVEINIEDPYAQAMFCMVIGYI